MTPPLCKLVIWTGAKHSGKTTTALHLVQQARARGFSVAGLLAPAVYENGHLAGFDAVDLNTAVTAPLARRGLEGTQRIGPFGLLSEGLAIGIGALGSPAALSAELVLVDEFGRLELHGGGWRSAVDALVSTAVGVIILVVREELTEEVRQLYSARPCEAIPAGDPGASKVINILQRLDKRLDDM